METLPMNNSSSKQFYLFKGDWYDRFIELMDLVQKNQQENFSIWEPQDKNKEYNLIIVTGRSLPEEYCFDKNIWKTDEKTFDSFYRPKIDKFNIYGNDNATTEIKEPGIASEN